MGNDWNSFMQSKAVRVVLYGICVGTCAVYAAGAVNDLRFPENSAILVESMGLTGFYVMTGVRLVVMLWVALVFVRMLVKAIRGDDE